MRNEQPVAISRLDYQPPVWLIPTVNMHFDLQPSRTRVTSQLALERQTVGPLRLDGVGLDLKQIKLDGNAVLEGDYTLTDTHLEFADLPDQCLLEITVEINPSANTALEGLYLSSGNFCTQCEAEGFRKINYFLDRPDVLSVYTVSIKAPAKEFPVLLSNGNCVSASIEGEYGYAQWHDPYPKPSYLFALVAGDLSVIQDTFITQSGRSVDLYIYVEQHNIDKCDYGMQALKRSMRWDEQVYGLEYDLDRYMIVAVDDFNMGAMENKGLNVFNSKYVLANADTATDNDFIGVEAVIAHEYFHNWTGNRVTCRDWFQLSLKEGLTVFRDQEFTADMHDATVKRIEDVRLLRARQFPEDASPMAHPVRPESFIEINNFYTLTVYEKGAELIRMMHTLLGAKAYRQGIDLYFERHDGQAVTCDDFVAAMQDASGVDLTQFSLWYSQAGTPRVTVVENHDEKSQTYKLTLKQHCPDTPGQTNKKPMHIPVLMGLLDQNGNELALPGESDQSGSKLLHLTQAEQSFNFDDITSKPVLSIFRKFSAPVTLVHECTDSELALLAGSDSDAFNRWDASQRLVTRLIERSLLGEEVDNTEYLDAIALILDDEELDPSIKAEVFSLPSIDTLAEAQQQVDIPKLHSARCALQRAIAQRFETQLNTIVQTQLADKQDYVVEHSAIGKRKLANTALSLLTHLPSEAWLALTEKQYRSATNMTDKVAALGALMYSDGEERQAALEDFYNHYKDQRLVIDKWFSIQAATPRSDVIDTVIGLSKHAAFELSNPNRVRSLIGAFASGNPVGLHEETGRGYKLLAHYVLTLDALNPQIAARLVSPLTRWRRFTVSNAELMKAQLIRISEKDVSIDVHELVSKSLHN